MLPAEYRSLRDSAGGLKLLSAEASSSKFPPPMKLERNTTSPAQRV